ncbi:hypothetical protein RF11_14662 [Thelohanellus kitauei]|uniref:Uncharacterized protein n=1 Tax=Thelohanellus kitauei TaxID=669202 RepID=A0A0C2MI21_THEKT|nr:hypothetical protein RF11_14662 [Thelohanellus kitauei]
MFYSVDSRCYVEAFHFWEHYNPKCTGPNHFIESIYQSKLINNNACIDDLLIHGEMEICHYQYNYDTISLLVRNKLLFYLIYENYKQIHELPPELQGNGSIYDVEIDKFEKCIYIQVKNGIMRKCYSIRKEIKAKYDLIIRDSNIQGMEIDLRTNHLYYYDKNSITLLHTRFFTKLTLYQTENWIYYFKLDLNTE